MLIAQITDVHLGFKPGGADELNRRRLDRVLDRLRAMKPRPDMLLVTGDIADKGDDSLCYARFKQALSTLPYPAFPVLGNHDGRAGLLEHFPALPTNEGFIQYAIEDYPVRILVLDTVEEGRHGGAFCETRAAWLKARLDEQPDRPTIIALHHPPMDSGLSWMKEDPDAPWIRRLHDIVAAQTNILALLSGHLHRPVISSWAGTLIAICPSTAPLVMLDLDSLDPDAPDGRPMIVDDGPFYALHLWNGRGLVSHFDSVGDQNVLARFGPEMQPFLRMLRDERMRSGPSEPQTSGKGGS